MQISGRFVGDAYMRPVAFTRYIALSVWRQLIGTKNRDCAARFPGIFVQLYDFEKNVDKRNQLGLK